MNRHEIRIEGGGPYPIPSHDFFFLFSIILLYLFWKNFYFPSLSLFFLSVYFILENVRRKAWREGKKVLNNASFLPILFFHLVLFIIIFFFLVCLFPFFVLLFFFFPSRCFFFFPGRMQIGFTKKGVARGPAGQPGIKLHHPAMPCAWATGNRIRPNKRLLYTNAPVKKKKKKKKKEKKKGIEKKQRSKEGFFSLPFLLLLPSGTHAGPGG